MEPRRVETSSTQDVSIGIEEDVPGEGVPVVLSREQGLELISALADTMLCNPLSPWLIIEIPFPMWTPN